MLRRTEPNLTEPITTKLDLNLRFGTNPQAYQTIVYSKEELESASSQVITVGQIMLRRLILRQVSAAAAESKFRIHGFDQRVYHLFFLDFYTK